jgi:ATP-binding protein involved in chromosome partitioning
VVFGNEVIVDVTISNPTLQAKKKVESEIKKAILSKVDEKIDVKVNVKTSAAPKKEEKSTLIKGKKNPIYTKYYCNCFR